MKLLTGLAPLALCALLVACGPPDERGTDDPLEDVVDTLGEDTAVDDPGIAVPTPALDPDAGLEDETALDSGVVVIDTEEGARERERGAPGGDLPEWTTGEVSWSPERAPPPAIARELRHARNDGYDRWVVEFAEGRLPGYTARYVDRPLHECGSGHQIHPVGEGWLELHLEPARGHTEEGQATLRAESETPGLEGGLHVYRTCDFEAVLTLVLAVASPEPFRVFHLSGPARIVVDVRH